MCSRETIDAHDVDFSPMFMFKAALIYIFMFTKDKINC